MADIQANRAPANREMAPRVFGYITEQGVPILEPPSERALRRIQAMDQATYFPSRWEGELVETIDLGGYTLERHADSIVPFVTGETRVVTKVELEALRKLDSSRTTLIYHTLQDLNGQIARDFPGQRLGIRGLACSVDEPVSISSGGEPLNIKNLEQVLQDGTERRDNTTAVTDFSPERPEIQSRSIEWMFQSARELRRALAQRPDLASQIHPVVAVYDNTDGTLGYYASSLPAAAEDRSSSILRAYVLDFPHA